MRRFFLFCLFLLYQKSFAGLFESNTLVKTATGYRSISALKIGDPVICNAGSDQWIVRPIIAIKRKDGLYALSVQEYHNYVVTESDLIVSNFIPVIAISLPIITKCSIAPVICYTVETAVVTGVIAVVVNLTKTILKKNKRSTPTCENGPNPSQSPTNPNPDDDDEDEPKSVHNMKEFFEKTKFGRAIKNRVQKTNKIQQGQSVYRVIKDIDEYALRKGEELYLDALHKNHLEVFTKNGIARTVLDLSGKELVEKVSRIGGRTIL